MQELLIFRINDSKDLDVYYKDRDMKDFVNVAKIKYTTFKIHQPGISAGSEPTLLNTNVIEFIIYNELPRFQDVRPELARFLQFLYNTPDEPRSVTIKDFMKKYIDYEDLSIWDSHIIEFDKNLYKAKMYFEYIFNVNKTVINFCYDNGTVLKTELVSDTLDNFKNSKYEFNGDNLIKFIETFKLLIDVNKVLKVFACTNLYVKEIIRSKLLESVSTTIIKNEMISFYDIKLEE